MEQFQENNPNPAISVGKDGMILYSNEVSVPLLRELSVVDIVQKEINQKCVNIFGVDTNSSHKDLEEKPQESEAREVANLELADILDIPAIKSLMDDLHELTHVVIALVDLKGNALIGVGWQDICTQFHRVHPETCKHCMESDTKLSLGVDPGEFKIYKCKNNMWDVSTPLIVDGQHIGNVFSGQFFFDDESLDYELFRSQAKKYGFNENEYIATLEKVPKLSRDAVNKNMSFFVKLANMISQLSHSNFKLAKSLKERDILVDKLEKSREDLNKAHNSLEAKVKERTSELEKAYESLMEEERRLSEAQKIAHVGNWDWNLATNEIYGSDEMCRIFGRFSKRLFHTHSELLNFIHPEDQNYVDNAVKNALNGKSFSIDHRVISADSEERIVHTQGEVVFDGNKTPIQMRGTIQDITDHKKAEEKIRILADAVESSNDAIVTESFDGTITSWNKTAEKIYGYSAEEILGKNVSILEPDNLKGEIKTIIEKVKQREKVQHYRTLRLKKDGTITNVSVTYSPVFDAFGELKAVSAITRDITEQINAERLLSKAEETRKKEIHHRIKNNLQVISSLLDLQAEKFRSREYVENVEVLNAIRESQDRVMSIALIHEELHKGRGTDTLNFSAYLERLVENLFQTYRVGNVNTNLNIDLEENIFFDMDIAVPFGIITNELVSNSLKHAFIGRDNGKIQIKLQREDSAEHASKEQGNTKESYNGTDFALIVSDNGIGIPEDFNLEDSSSLGLQLVEILVDQVGGEIELKKDSGTEFCIRFTAPVQNRKQATKEIK